MIYLDYASTTPVLEEVVDSYAKLLKTDFANTSSIHSLGLKVNSYLEASRAQILKLFKRSEDQIIFTSGATESNNLAIKGFVEANKGKGKHLITSAIEHPSVLGVFKELEANGFELTVLSCNQNGIVEEEALRNAIRKDTILVSIMTLNNETGIIQPYEKYYKICQEKKITYHSDITQALGKINLDFSCFDMASFSAHKIHGLKGSGGLFKKKNIRLNPQLIGGGQEYGLRSGTTNWPLNVTLAKTIRLSLEKRQENYNYVLNLHKFLYQELENNSLVKINSSNNYQIQSPYILNLSVPKRQSEVIIHGLEEHGFCVSSTSACGSKKDNYSYVILDMSGSMELASSAIRVSLSKDVTLSQIKEFINALNKVLVERN